MKPMPVCARLAAVAAPLLKTLSTCVMMAVLIGASALPRAAQAGEIPAFTVDASWPKPLPNNWILGQVGGITVDSEGLSGSSIGRAR